jgi:hypothetical protein
VAVPRHVLLCCCVALVAALLAPALQAQPGRRGGEPSLRELLREQGAPGSWESTLRESLRDGRADPGARRAAEQAVARHGGRVLSVVPAGERYRVRLLLDNGRVITATVED